MIRSLARRRTRRRTSPETCSTSSAPDHGHVARSGDAQDDAVALDTDDAHLYVGPDPDRLAGTARQDEHQPASETGACSGKLGSSMMSCRAVAFSMSMTRGPARFAVYRRRLAVDRQDGQDPFAFGDQASLEQDFRGARLTLSTAAAMKPMVGSSLETISYSAVSGTALRRWRIECGQPNETVGEVDLAATCRLTHGLVLVRRREAEVACTRQLTRAPHRR